MTKPPDIADIGFSAGHVEPMDQLSAGPSQGEIDATLARTDHGNAKAFVARHGADLRFCPPRGWLIWDGTRWARDERRSVEMRARLFAEDLLRGVNLLPESDVRALQSRARAAAQWRAIRAITELSKCDPTIAVADIELDAQPLLLNVANGTLDLASLTLRTHGRTDLLTQLAPVHFDLELAAPTWDAFLDRITMGDPELRSFLARAAFLSALGEVREHVFFFLHGVGANGKTVFVDTLLRVLGDYALQIDPRLLLATTMGGEGPTPGLASLRGARFVVANETEREARLAEARIKELTGGGLVSARRTYGEPFTFRPCMKLWLVSNYPPRLRGSDFALMRRLLVVPFEAVIPREQQDLGLVGRLDAERSGILSWMVREGAEVLRRGLDPPARVRAATERIRLESDEVAAFLEACTSRTTDGLVTARDLYDAFCAWTLAEGRPRAMGDAEFKRRVEATGYQQVKRSRMFWVGLTLRPWQGGLGGSDRTPPVGPTGDVP